MKALKPATSKTIYVLIAVTAIVIALGVLRSRENIAKPGLDSQVQPAAAAALSSPEPFFDFGNISMAAGNVSHRFRIRNTGAVPTIITKLTTSCMCTAATLITRAGRKGPFGMPGHGPVAGIAERLAPGEDARVEIVFDPTAHGPAGIGLNERSVTVRSDSGQALELRFRAMVKP